MLQRQHLNHLHSPNIWSTSSKLVSSSVSIPASILKLHHITGLSSSVSKTCSFMMPMELFLTTPLTRSSSLPRRSHSSLTPRKIGQGGILWKQPLFLTVIQWLPPSIVTSTFGVIMLHQKPLSAPATYITLHTVSTAVKSPPYYAIN